MGSARVVYLDSHVLIRLYDGSVEMLGAAARRAIERYDLLSSAACVLELEILHEIGRIKPTAAKLVDTLAADFGLRVCDLPFRKIVEHAIKEGWTRDPFDRLIVANARAAGAPLATKDERIRDNYNMAVW